MMIKMLLMRIEILKCNGSGSVPQKKGEDGKWDNFQGSQRSLIFEVNGNVQIVALESSYCGIVNMLFSM